MGLLILLAMILVGIGVVEWLFRKRDQKLAEAECRALLKEMLTDRK